MIKLKKIKGKVSAIIAVTIAAIFFIPYVYSAHCAYEKYVENVMGYESMYFSDAADIGKLHVLDNLAKMTEEVNNTGFALSAVGTAYESYESFFEAVYKTTGSDVGLIFAGNGALTYGDREYESLFMETAKEAVTSGGDSVSELIECSDGIKRFGIAAAFTELDGGTAAVVLLFPQSALDLILNNLKLSDIGRLLIVDLEGRFIAQQKSEGSWPEEGQFAADKTDNLKEQLLEISATKDGKQYMIYAKPAGINDWYVVYAEPKDQLDIQMDVGFNQIHIFGAFSLLLFLGLIAFGFYKGDLQAQRMELFKKKFNIATSQSARAAFEYDRRTNRLSFISESEHVKLPKPNISLEELGNRVHPEDRAAYLQAVAELREKGTTSTTVRVFNFCGKDIYRWYHVTATRLTKNGEGKALTIGTVEDIDERENERLILYEKATTDSLTGLWNRAETEKAVNERLMKLGQNEHSVFAIIDIDDFKNINDEFGHDCGDKALIHFSENLRDTFRFGDIIGRLGGDEFVVFMALTADKDAVERRLMELMKSMHSDCDDGKCLLPKITCSIGCCIAYKGDTFESVYRHADEALYKSKTRGKGQFTIV